MDLSKIRQKNQAILRGRITGIEKESYKTDTFVKSEITLETDGNYPDTMKVEFVQNNEDLVDDLAEGMEIDVLVFCGGRTGGQNGFVFNSYRGLGVDILSGEKGQDPKPEPEPDPEPEPKKKPASRRARKTATKKKDTKTEEPPTGDDDDDLPF